MLDFFLRGDHLFHAVMQALREVCLLALLLEKLLEGVGHALVLFHLLLHELSTGLARCKRKSSAQSVVVLELLGCFVYFFALVGSGGGLDVELVQQSLDPLLHIGVVASNGVPLDPLVAIGAGHEGHEAWEALNIVSVGRVTIVSAVDLEELDFVAQLSLHVLNDAVPVRHELDAVSALRHEEVDDDQGVLLVLCHLLVEFLVAVRHSAASFFPPVAIHA